jgi:SAM-dependent methyltransferase
VSRAHYLAHLASFGAADLHPMGRAGTRRLSAALRAGPRDRVLELGCGTGQTMVRMASSGASRVVGVDVMDEMLRVARARLRLAGLGARARLLRADGAVGLPFADATFDRALAESVLGFQPPGAARALFAEIFRVLKSGGRFVANEAVWKPGTPLETASSLHASEESDFGLGQACAAGWSIAEWSRCAREAGFAVESSERLGASPSGTASDARGGLIGRWRAKVASRVVTLFYATRGLLSGELRRERLEYRARLARHEQDGMHVEARLLVLVKPADDREMAGARSAALSAAGDGR